MTVSKSKKYKLNSKGEEGTGTQYSFSFDKNNNLIGINQGAGLNGQYRETPIDPSSDLFNTLANSESALEAMNVNKFKGKATQTAMQIASTEELTQHYNNKDKKRTNEDIDVKTEDKIMDTVYKNIDNSTLIIISHRENTIKNCDKVIEIEE